MRSFPTSAARQSGVAFYLFVVFALLSLTALGTVSTSLFSDRTDAGERARQTLFQARELVIAELTQPMLRGPAARLGQFVRLPDLPTAAGAGAEATEPNYDGLAEVSGCAFRGWANGQPLRPADISGAAARCFGRVPWQSLGLTVESAAAADLAGDMPWLIISPNLAASQACAPHLNPLMLSQPFAGYNCPVSQPYPWIRVLDARGNLLSDRVAFALVMPGPALPGQVRAPTAAISQYLDAARIIPTCAAPCQPGRVDNANFNHADNQAWTLIQADKAGPAVDQNRLYATPHLFNDTVIFVTIDELLAHLEQRSLRAIRVELDRFQTSNGYLPYAASLGDASKACVNANRFGHLPTAAGSCGDAPALPAWLTASGWQHYFLYAVSPRCVAANPACNAPGLVLDARTNINALMISPGHPIQRPPFAVTAGGIQRPLVAGAYSANPADWLDTIENAGGTPDVFVSFERAAAPRNDRLYSLQ
ncbi:MAG: hypothetical protein AB8C46_09235 [Burkholderiaceae bacterium]